MPNIDQHNLEDLEKTLGYTFKRQELLREALTHPSIDASGSNDENRRNYQRLEFLGDRVLGLIIAHMLLSAFPNEGEGDIAKRHTVLVQAKALFEVANQMDLGKYLTLSLGEHKSGGRHKMAVLSDATEAVIGAIYLDGGLDAARNFIDKYWGKTLNSYEKPPTDAKTELQEWAQARSLPLPHYVLLERSGTDHEPVFEMEVRIKDLDPQVGIANSKRKSQKRAAEAMLAHIKTLTDRGDLQ
jgi:ribonuclease-3